MRALLFSALIGIAAFGCKQGEPASSAASSHGDDEVPEVPEISMADVEAGLAAGSLTVIDCNGAETRKKHGVVKGATLVDNEETYPASVLPADKQAKLVFYCGGPG